MRPEILNSYFSSVIALKGIGDKVEKLLHKLLRPGVENPLAPVGLINLLFHLPAGVIDRRTRPTIATLPQEGIVTVKVVVGNHKKPPPHNKRVPYRVECFDDTGTLSLVFFHVHGDYLQRILPVGDTRFVSGRIEWYSGMPQMVHPDHMVSEQGFKKLPLVEPVYPLTAGLSGKTLGRAISQALDQVPPLPEWQDKAWLEKNRFCGFNQALELLHQPENADVIDPASIPRQRLAYDELLANQLALALVRRSLKQTSGRAIASKGDLFNKVKASLPFELTASQAGSISEILTDMAKNQRMLRLLQGDVGAGKTIVALAALLNCVETGRQGALMVPTEILARQHLTTLSQLCDALGIRVDILTGRDKAARRQEKLALLNTGQIDILIGTHALFQNDVEFADLALVVIDEQHRFGVHQRLSLQAKSGMAPDVLVMTATPIPRTLTLTLYGDMDVSRLTDKPAGRKPIKTSVIPMEKLFDVMAGLDRVLTAGGQVYWVCPLVEDNDELDLTAAQDRFEVLQKHYPGKCGLVHGRMKSVEKDQIMQQFQNGEITILVATTVIEVGVDVTQANTMVIENAEQFGLAQLHQLRGRVGRGSQESSCVLLYRANPGETAIARLKIMRESQDGFLIAEEDLRLRGSGELLGVRQSGAAMFKLANPIEHHDLLAAAKDDTDLILQKNPALTGEHGSALRVLLYLFERDAAIRLLTAG